MHRKALPSQSLCLNEHIVYVIFYADCAVFTNFTFRYTAYNLGMNDVCRVSHSKHLTHAARTAAASMEMTVKNLPYSLLATFDSASSKALNNSCLRLGKSALEG